MLPKFAKISRFFATTNYYSLLGVSEDSSFAQIKKKYLQKIKTSHPDSEEGSHKKFIDLQSAYETLTHPMKRKIYDESIGIKNGKWQYFHINVNPQFQNQQFQEILKGNIKNKVKIKAISENLTMRYKQQLHYKQHKKNLYTSLLFPMASFGLFWVFWQLGQKITFVYQGDTTYQHKKSGVGRDLSIAVTQIR